jgi:hypothetical protein
MGTPKMGGKPTLRVFLKANEDVTDSLLSIRDGGRKVERGLRELVQEKYQGRFALDILQEPCGRADLTLQEVEGPYLPADLHAQGSRAGAFRSRLGRGPFDVVVLSLLPDVLPSREGALSVAEFEDTLSRLVRALQERCDAHVLVYNCSSFDPADHVHNYHSAGGSFALRAHQLNLCLMRTSLRQGISIIDVDRVIAELGGRHHVEQAGRYSAEACQAIGREFLRVLEDIGFFEERPVVPQLGQPGLAGKRPAAAKEGP